jgi:class 3 adenylate cyclase
MGDRPASHTSDAFGAMLCAVESGRPSGTVTAHGGFVFSRGGDGVAVAFQRAGDAVAAAIEEQRALVGEGWPPGVDLRVRMGLHTGEADERDGDDFGPPLNRAARLMGAAHGGQILMSATEDRTAPRSPASTRGASCPH